MSTEAAKNDSYIRLSVKDDVGQVMVEPENEDRFVLSARDAAAACYQHAAIQQFESQFRSLLQKLGAWIQARRDVIERAYVTVRDGALMLVVVRTCLTYDSAFDDELTDLDLEVAGDDRFDLLRLNVMSLPRCDEDSEETFLSREFTWAYAK